MLSRDLKTLQAQAAMGRARHDQGAGIVEPEERQLLGTLTSNSEKCFTEFELQGVSIESFLFASRQMAGWLPYSRTM